MKALMSLDDAAEESSQSVLTLRKAIRSTSTETFPPPLRAKLGSRGQYLVRDVDLRAWIESLKDA